MKLLLDLSVLDLNDYIDFEDATDSSVIEAVGAMAKGRATAAQQRGLTWIFGRKVDRHFTLHDAGTFRPGEVEWDLPSDESAD